MNLYRPSVSVVIPAYNAERWIEGCLESVRAQRYEGGEFEVLVVNNMSTDATADLIRRAGFEPLTCERRGASAARNVGIEKAKGEIIVFLDSDAVADPEWLERLVAPFEDEAVGGVGGRVDPYRVETGPEYHAVLCRVLDQEKHLAGEPPFIEPFVATANAAYRASALREAEGFDESLSICEDADLAWRVRWAGHGLAYAEGARARHHNRSRRGPYFRQMYDYGQGTVRLFAKHRRLMGRRVWIAWGHFGALAWALLRAPAMAIFGRTKWDRVAALYDLAAGIAWTAGRISESVKRKVLVV